MRLVSVFISESSTVDHVASCGLEGYEALHVWGYGFCWHKHSVVMNGEDSCCQMTTTIRLGTIYRGVGAYRRMLLARCVPLGLTTEHVKMHQGSSPVLAYITLCSSI